MLLPGPPLAQILHTMSLITLSQLVPKRVRSAPRMTRVLRSRSLLRARRAVEGLLRASLDRSSLRRSKLMKSSRALRCADPRYSFTIIINPMVYAGLRPSSRIHPDGHYQFECATWISQCCPYDCVQQPYGAGIPHGARG